MPAPTRLASVRRNDCDGSVLLAGALGLCLGSCGVQPSGQVELRTDVEIDRALSSAAIPGLLILAGDGVTDDGLNALVGCADVEDIWLRGTQNVNGRAFDVFATWPGLRSVSLWNVPIRDEQAFAFLERNDSIGELILCLVSVADGHLDQISRSKSLACVRLDSVDGLADGAIRKLGGIRSLSMLSVARCVGVTSDDIAAIRGQLPSCSVVFEPSR